MRGRFLYSSASDFLRLAWMGFVSPILDHPNLGCIDNDLYDEMAI